MDVLIADSSTIINSRLKMLISDASSQAVIYQAKSYDEAIALFAEKKTAVVVLDSGLPGNRSVNLLEEIKRVNEKTVVIVLSLQCDTYTRQKFTAANFFFDKYNEHEKITAIINNLSKTTVNDE